MSTLSTIQTGSGNDALSGEQDTVLPAANTPAGLIGLFEELIAKAAAPDSNEKTPLKEPHPQTPNVETPNTAKPSALAGPSQKSKGELDAATSILNFLMAQSGKIESTTGSKSAAKPGTGTPGTDNNSQSQTGAIPMADVSTIEMLAGQMLAAAFPAMNQVVKSNAETLAAASKNGPTIKSAAIPAISSQVNPNIKAIAPDTTTPAAAAKIPAANLSANQTTAAVPAFTGQKAISFAANEAGTSATSPATAQIDTATLDSSKDNSSPGQDNPSAKDSHPDISTAAQLQSLSNGTSIAKQDIAMQQAEKMNKFAGQMEKVLPGEGFSTVHTSSASLPSPDATQAATSTAAAASSVENAATSISPTDSVAVPVSSDMRTRTLERTQELVTVNATRLNDLGNSSMQVVIKPDAGTQLSLELRQQGGGAVEVQAVLQQGDFNHLNQQWSHLQHSLEQRGIKLAPLTDDAAAFANNSSSEMYQNKQNQTTEGVPQMSLAGASAGITPAAVSAPEAKQASVYQGWETWA